ncbi:MAG: hypothetical protein CME64_03200 [Halobacteriovoraceae bacterium]|nr:hypothetical protein [Halobacteriovoraceae bacterium]|tara:strand:- start:3399 stop:4838 length:1440 start_codon:yes stop_codon:yes gene_type:complete
MRFKSNIGALDDILKGGFIKGASYLLKGHPGTGKTVLTNEIAFRHASNGGRVLYLSGLAEGNEAFLEHLKAFDWFDQNAPNKSIYYYSLLSMVNPDEGLESFTQNLTELLSKLEVSMLVIDSLQTFDPLPFELDEVRIMVNKVKAAARILDITLFVLQTPNITVQDRHQEQADLDGIISLSVSCFQQKRVRKIEVLKLRGSDYLLGPHSFKISDSGCSFFPRLEVYYRDPLRVTSDVLTKSKVGIEKLDAMLGGGLVKGSMTSLLGAPGTGKTSIGVQFLCEGAQEKESCMYFGFYETIQRLSTKMDGLSIPLKKFIDEGYIKYVWQPVLENDLDELAERLLDQVEEHKVTRLFIDGIDGFKFATDHPNRIFSFWASLCNELRSREVTVIFSEELGVFQSTKNTGERELAAIIENIVYLGYVEHKNSLERFLSILKVREGNYDPQYKKFTMNSNGLDLANFDRDLRLFRHGTYMEQTHG